MKNIYTLLLLFIFCSAINAQDSISFIIRVDDILSRNTTLLPRSIHHFGNAVLQKGGKVTWAVIPHRLIETQNSDGVLAQELKTTVNDGHEIVLHGYNHICPLCGSSGHEMFCAAQNIPVPYSSQKDSLTAGLNILLNKVNVIPETFVPPGHAQDTTTFSVLLDLGIKYISSKGKTKDFIYKELFNLSANNEYTWQLTASNYSAKLNDALADIRTAGAANGYYCLLLHDPFIRQGYENGIVVNWISELLDSLNNEYGNKIKYKTLTAALKEFKQQQTTYIAENNSHPDNFILYQNYPNPFNPSTKIKYTIPPSANGQSSVVNLNVYDVLGNEVAELVNEIKEPGEYEIKFNAASLPSGIYFYKIQTGEFNKTMKMLLLK